MYRGHDRPLVATNDTHVRSALAFTQSRGAAPAGTTRARYARLRLDLEALSGPPSVERAFAALGTVAERGARYRTQWSAICETRKVRLHITPDKAKRTFTIDASALDYATGSGTTFQDLCGKELGNGRFLPLTMSAPCCSTRHSGSSRSTTCPRGRMR